MIFDIFLKTLENIIKIYKMEIGDSFFSHLSQRLRKENHLSDITWAFCCTSDNFKRFFIEYCFDEKIKDNISLEREYSREDSRPDFFFEDDSGQEYLIEVKIYDRNDHFEQYSKVFPSAKKSIISNYYIAPEKNWCVKTWKDFIQELENNISIFPGNEIELVKYYLTYSKSVTNFVEVKPVDLSNLSSLKDFYNLLHQVVEECQVVQLNEWTASKSAQTPDAYGKYLYYKCAENKDLYFWIGLHFPDESMYIYIQYEDKGYCPERERKILKELKPGKYYDELIPEGAAIWIPLRREYFDRLCKKTAVESQKEVIKNFMEEVLLRLK